MNLFSSGMDRQKNSTTLRNSSIQITGDYTSVGKSTTRQSTIWTLPSLSKTTKYTPRTTSKTVDCNSFLDYKSDHHKNWLNNMPYCQFRHIRRNCTNQTDYRIQSKVLSARLRKKHCPPKIISGAYKKASTPSQRT